MYDNQQHSKRKERRFFTSPAVSAIVKIVAVGIFTLSLAISTLLVIFIIVGAAAVSGGGPDRSYAGYQKFYVDEHKLSLKSETASEIAVIHINGVITEYDQRSTFLEYIENPVDGVRNRLDIIRMDDNVQGVLLVVDSPGGGVTASDVLYNHVMGFREETGIPVVTFMKQVAASGAYYVAAASDAIVAYPTTITGSIGVIMYSFNFSGLMEKYGVEYVPIKTSERKDSLSPFKPVEQTEVAWMQTIVDQMLDRFVDAIDAGRDNLSRDEVAALADGRIYIAAEAQELGLIDQVGYFDDAVVVLTDMAGIEDPVLVEFEREMHFRDIIGRVRLHLPRSILDDRIMRQGNLELYYLWDAVLYQQ
jgi:protease-4